MRGESVGGIRQIACFSQILALAFGLSFAACDAGLADAPAVNASAAPAIPAPGDAPASLPQDSFFSSLKQAFNKDFDHEVVRGHFDLGSAPSAHRYYCLIDPKTGKRESNGVLGQTFSMPGGMTGIKDSSVSLYRCADAEKQGILVTAGYGVDSATVSKPAPQVPADAAATPAPLEHPAAVAAAVLPAAASTAPASPTAGASGSTVQNACAAAAYGQFDFWLGDWDVFDSHTQARVARVHVTRTLDDCVLWEQYRGTDGQERQSFSIYDASRAVWHQTWVTNRGQLLVIEGGLHTGAMEMSGSEHTADGTVRLVRINWQQSHDVVHEAAYWSTDGGKTWIEWLGLEFRPHHT